MNLVHGYLLFGLAALSLPILIHLLHRQKPKAMPFPAFRFLKLKRSTNSRKMRLQNILLLLARLLVVVLIVLALARPQVSGAKTPFNGTQAVFAVFVFDTSPSMDYTVAGESRLDESRKRAKELLTKIAPQSKIRLLQTGEGMPAIDDTESWLQGRAIVEGRIDELRTRPVVESVPRSIDAGVAMLTQASQEENRPRVLVVFSDRTVPSWPNAVPKVPDDIHTLYVDVGIDRPRNLTIESIETRPSVVVAGAKLEVRVGVRATGGEFNTVLNCLFENDAENDPSQTRQQVRLADGEKRVYVFERTVPALASSEAPAQLAIRLDGSDPLLFDNAGYASVPARTKRKLLLVADNAKDARAVRTALNVIALERPAEAFDVSVMNARDAAKIPLEKMQDNAIVILHQTAPPPALWDLLAGYVESGGGLMIVPGGDEFARDEFNGEGQRAQLLPGTLKQVVKVPVGKPGVRWAEFQRGHALGQAFVDLKKSAKVDFDDATYGPQVTAYWEVEPAAGSVVVAAYRDESQRPALIEKRRGRGRVLLFTLPLDGRKMDETRGWHNYWKDSSFGLVLIDLACQDLAGRVSVQSLRFTRGQEVRLTLPVPTPTPPFKVTGPGLSESETRVAWTPAKPGDAVPDVVLPQAVSAGNYQLRDSKDRILTGFSLTEPANESNLARVPVESIAAVLGDKALVPSDRELSLTDVLGQSFTPPTELLPFVLMALLGLLVAESWLANRYYKPVPQGDAADTALRPTGELTRSRL